MLCPVIEVEGLGKTYFSGGEPVHAVRDLSFVAEPGTIFGLLGPNGAGKTTTLRIIASVLQPTRGTVRVAGHDVVADPVAVRRQIGFLSASTALYDRLSPRETMRYFGRLNGLADDALEARITDLVTTLEMTDFADRLCGLLSSGQKQKTSIARALVHDPPVLVFDEPTAALDVLVARALLERIASLRDARRTIILSTHIMSEAERLCDRVAIVHKGTLHAQGTVAELQEQTGQDNLEDAFFTLIREDAGAPT
jgi:sodium transport system ATP-binding protein